MGHCSPGVSWAKQTPHAQAPSRTYSGQEHRFRDSRPSEPPGCPRIRPIEYASFVHPRRDPGCFREAHDFLRPLSREYDHALVIFDRVGSGREDRTAAQLSAEVRARLAASGWEDRCAVIVVDPELEVWAFGPSSQVERSLEWPRRRPSLRRWLEIQGLWHRGQPKPRDPKEALERALRDIGKPRSSAIYRRIGERVSLQRCEDSAFLRLRNTLTT